MKLKRSGILVKIVLIVLAVYAMTSLVRLRASLESARNTQLKLQQQVSELLAENEQTRYAIEHSTSDDVISSVARDKLGIFAPGEQLFYSK